MDKQNLRRHAAELEFAARSLAAAAAPSNTTALDDAWFWRHQITEILALIDTDLQPPTPPQGETQNA